MEGRRRAVIRQTELKKRVLDSVGIGIGAPGAEPLAVVHRTVQRANQGEDCTLWGRDETASPVGRFRVPGRWGRTKPHLSNPSSEQLYCRLYLREDIRHPEVAKFVTDVQPAVSNK